MEQQFDQIAEGKEQWTDMMKDFEHTFEPTVEKVINARSEHKAGERKLGDDPKSGRPVFVKIGRFGPVVQIGSADDEQKPQFAQLPADKRMDSITLEEALEYIADDELVEITPKNIRLRKRLLNATDRKKAAVRAGQVNK